MPGVSLQKVQEKLGSLGPQQQGDFIYRLQGDSGIMANIFSIAITPHIFAGMLQQFIGFPVIKDSFKSINQKMEGWSYEGPLGQAKINTFYNASAFVLAIFQGLYIAYQWNAYAITPNVLFLVQTTLTLTCGAMVCGYLSTLIQDKGLGEGMGVLIATSGLGQFASQWISLVRDMLQGVLPYSKFILICFIYVSFVWSIVYMQQINLKLQIVKHSFAPQEMTKGLSVKVPSLQPRQTQQTDQPFKKKAGNDRNAVQQDYKISQEQFKSQNSSLLQKKNLDHIQQQGQEYDRIQNQDNIQKGIQGQDRQYDRDLNQNHKQKPGLEQDFGNDGVGSAQRAGSLNMNDNYNEDSSGDINNQKNIYNDGTFDVEDDEEQSNNGSADLQINRQLQQQKQLWSEKDMSEFRFFPVSVIPGLTPLFFSSQIIAMIEFLGNKGVKLWVFKYGDVVSVLFMLFASFFDPQIILQVQSIRQHLKSTQEGFQGVLPGEETSNYYLGVATRARVIGGILQAGFFSLGILFDLLVFNLRFSRQFFFLFLMTSTILSIQRDIQALTIPKQVISSMKKKMHNLQQKTRIL